MLKAYFNQSGTSEPTVYAQYLYDAGGNRIKKLIRTQGGDYETVVYIDEMFIYHQKDGEGEKNEISIKDDKSRIACIRVGDTFTGDFPESEYYILEDHLGSSTIRLKHTPGGTKIDREEYYPFGDSSLRTFDKKKYQYVGKEKDSESGLYYYGARYYTAWTCRFISVDPLAAKYAHLNPYNNAGNKVINQKDIDGLQAENEKESQSSKNDPSKNKTESEVIQSIPEIDVHQIPKDYKQVDKQWAIDQKREGTEESDNLVRAKLPGQGTKFFKKNSEAKAEDKEASESKSNSQASTKESNESLDEFNTNAEDDTKKYKGDDVLEKDIQKGIDIYNEAKQLTETAEGKAAKLMIDIGEKTSAATIIDNEKEILKKKQMTSKRQVDSVNSLKKGNKVLGVLKKAFQRIANFISIPKWNDLLNDVVTQLKKGFIMVGTLIDLAIEVIGMTLKATPTGIAFMGIIAIADFTGTIDDAKEYFNKRYPKGLRF